MAIITGNNQQNELQGTASADTISARAGNDTVFAAEGNDRVLGGDGNDLASGEDGDDSIFGGNGRDDLSGGLGNDRLFGEGGNDRLSGGEGDDSLNGGIGLASRDTFFINANEGRDTIRDFQQGLDNLTLAGFTDIQDFNDLTAFINETNTGTVIDLSSALDQPVGTQVITLLGVTGLDETDVTLEPGPILFAFQVV